MLPLLAAIAQAAAQPIVALPAQPALTEVIAARDVAFFELLFDGCDPDRMAGMITDDFEFYHDKDGFSARSGAQFIDQYRKFCTTRQAPGSWRSRRELVRATLHVDPVPGHGAIEVGEHYFHERRTQGPAAAAVPETRVGHARFAQLWVMDGEGQWRLSRVFSYAHKSARAE